MSLLDRFFGKSGNGASSTEPLVANPAIEGQLGLQVLFPEAQPLDGTALTRALQAFDKSMGRARCELDDEISRDGNLFGIAGWGKHVIRLVGFDAPMPAFEHCVAPAHYSAELKQSVRAHRAHVLLYYAGYDPSPLEQYVALAAVAAVLGRNGALVVLNGAAQASLPMSLLSDIGAGSKPIEMLRALPLPFLYCGFVKHEVEDVRGVWMRTYGADLLGLPDFAAHASGHHEAQRHFDAFDNVLRYLLDSGAKVGRGHTMQIGAGECVRLRAPKLSESFLVPTGELFVLEPIGPEEINR